MDVAILTRVSKESQSYERQIADLNKYAISKDYNVVGEFNEKISGATKNEDRKAWNELMELIENQKIDKILIWELSRLGRNTLQVLKSLEAFHSKGISLYVLNYNIETLNEDGTVNPMAQMMVTMLAEFSRTERVAIQQRLSSGYRKHVDSGGRVGRIKGVKMDNSQLLEKHGDIVKYIKKGRSIREISAIVSKSTRTVLKVKKAYDAQLKTFEVRFVAGSPTDGLAIGLAIGKDVVKALSKKQAREIVLGYGDEIEIANVTEI